MADEVYACWVGDAFVELEDTRTGEKREFDFSVGDTFASVFGENAELMSGHRRPVRGPLTLPQALMYGRILKVPNANFLTGHKLFMVSSGFKGPWSAALVLMHYEHDVALDKHYVVVSVPQAGRPSQRLTLDPSARAMIAKAQRHKARIITRTGSNRLPCGHCHAALEHGAGGKKCGKCQMQYYCNLECQREHWPVHKSMCNDEEPVIVVCVDARVLQPRRSSKPSKPLKAQSILQAWACGVAAFNRRGGVDHAHTRAQPWLQSILQAYEGSSSL
jgi:hypothetical protein